MNRNLRHLLIAFVLLFGQYAAQQHALYHAGLAVAGAGQLDGKAPPSDHGVERCLAFQPLGNAVSCSAPFVAVSVIEPPAPAPFVLPLARPPRIEFDSRAPPRYFS